MTKQNNSLSLAVGSNDDIQLLDFEKNLLKLLVKNGLPTESIFVEIEERITVFQNLERVLRNIEDNKKQESIYISKFVAATASGLFDAALNYLWDETISELRQRVAQYDLSYFFDNAITNVEKRKKLGSVDDLTKIEDSELIYGAKGIGLDAMPKVV